MSGSTDLVVVTEDDDPIGESLDQAAGRLVAAGERQIRALIGQLHASGHHVRRETLYAAARAALASAGHAPRQRRRQQAQESARPRIAVTKGSGEGSLLRRVVVALASRGEPFATSEAADLAGTTAAGTKAYLVWLLRQRVLADVLPGLWGKGPHFDPWAARRPRTNPGGNSREARRKRRLRELFRIHSGNSASDDTSKMDAGDIHCQEPWSP